MHRDDALQERSIRQNNALSEVSLGGDRATLWRLHHVGFVVRSIHAVIADFLNSLSADWDGQIFHDPLQRANMTFLQPTGLGDSRIELVEPADEKSPVYWFSNTSGGLHHLCYEVADLDRHLKSMHSRGALIVKRPLPAAAFENRRIAWILTTGKLLLELLEKDKEQNEQHSQSTRKE